MKSAQERKANSIRILQKCNIPYIDWLPLVETAEMIVPRTAEEIAKRAIACLLAIQVACDFANDADSETIAGSREFFGCMAKTFGVENEFTEKEKVFFIGTPTQQEAVNMGWKYEAYWTLVWALGLVDELAYPNGICDCELAVNLVSKCGSFDEFISKVNLRSVDTILDQVDLTYRLHWACVDARINGRENPGGLNGGVVFERHWGLNWLIGKGQEAYDDWDNVDTST